MHVSSRTARATLTLLGLTMLLSATLAGAAYNK
jgi:hypothetical protein